mgnify:CR=1 FL=1
MKTNKFFAVALAALTLVGFNACKDKPAGGGEEPSNVTITLDKETADLEVGATLQLTATVTPAGTAVTWSSSAPDKATVSDAGLVTGVAEGRAMIVAKAGDKQAACIVTVGSVEDDLVKKMQPYLEGSDYYLFSMGEKTAAKLKAGAIKKDFRFNGGYTDEGTIPDDVTSLLEIWDDSFVSGAGGGLNSFGLLDGYISLVSSQGVWGSAGYGGFRLINRTDVDLSDIQTNKEEYTLVITYKCPANNANDGVKFTLESTASDGKVEIPVSGNTNGDWVVVERKMSTIFAQGLDWTAPWTTTAKAAFYPVELFIDKVGQGLDVDAVFIYKPKAE